jgi:hypothetical protein
MKLRFDPYFVEEESRTSGDRARMPDPFAGLGTFDDLALIQH